MALSLRSLGPENPELRLPHQGNLIRSSLRVQLGNGLLTTTTEFFNVTTEIIVNQVIGCDDCVQNSTNWRRRRRVSIGYMHITYANQIYRNPNVVVVRIPTV